MKEKEEIEEEEEPDQKIIEYDSKQFQLNCQIENKKIKIKLQSINDDPIITFSNDFNLQELQEINNYFTDAKNIEEALDIIKDLMIKKITIEKKYEKEINLIFHYLPKKQFEIILLLNVNKSEFYNSLSKEMKKIIDNNDMILGIDLGTTYSAASVMIDDKIIMIENSLGLRTTPSFVSFFGPYEICVGELAKLRPSNEGNIIYNSKRLLGKTPEDKKKDQKLFDKLNFKIEEDKHLEKLKIAINFKNWKNKDNNENNEIIEIKENKENNEIIEIKENNDNIIEIKENNENNEIIEIKENNENNEIIEIKENKENNEIIEIKENNEIIEIKDNNENNKIKENKENNKIIEIKENNDNIIEIKENNENNEIIEIKENNNENNEIIEIKDNNENNIIIEIKENNNENYEIIEIKENNENNKNNKKEYYPEQISAMILKKIVQDSEYYLSKKLGKEIKIKNAVITVPAYFNQKQREATIQAAEIIDLKVKRIINEPTAASLAYGYKTLGNDQKLIAVIDFGGGTLDITLLKFMKNNDGIYWVIKYSCGDSNFGGEDFDSILMEECLKRLNVNNVEKNTSFNIRLKRACEAAKIKLSSNDETNIIIEEYMTDKNINFHLKRKDFEKLCVKCFDKFKDKLKKFLKNCGENKNNIEEVILIGGSTLIPKIQNIVCDVFSKSLIRINLNPIEAVAQGASILGGIISKLPNFNNLNLLDVTNLSLGVELFGKKMNTVIKRSTPIPYENTKYYETAYDNQTSALIDIYEGENDDTSQNTQLGKFRIINLPKKKAREAKMKIKFDINNNSILTVTAYDLENESNFKKLEIEKPKGLSDIIKNIKKKDNKIEIIDIKEYNQIKDKILELEERVYNSSDNEEIDSLKGRIIETFGKFICDILINIHKEPLIFSYIKYYLKKMSKYYNNAEIGNNAFDFNEVLKKILQEIKLYKRELICEIIEPFVDFKNIYSECLFQLINSYYELIQLDFYNVEKLKQGTNEDKNLALMNLSKLKDIIQISLKFYQRLNNEGKMKMMHVKDLIQNYELKIEVKEYLIKYELKEINYVKEDEKEKLKNLVEKYEKCESAEFEDLKKLKEINQKINHKNQFIIKKNEKEKYFLYIFEKMSKDSHKKFFYLLEEFNPDEKKYNISDASTFVYETNREKQRDFLVKLFTDYDKLYDKEKEENNENKKEVYDKILKYLNYLRNKGTKKPLFDDIE